MKGACILFPFIFFAIGFGQGRKEDPRCQKTCRDETDNLNKCTNANTTTKCGSNSGLHFMDCPHRNDCHNQFFALVSCNTRCHEQIKEENDLCENQCNKETIALKNCTSDRCGGPRATLCHYCFNQMVAKIECIGECHQQLEKIKQRCDGECKKEGDVFNDCTKDKCDGGKLRNHPNCFYKDCRHEYEGKENCRKACHNRVEEEKRCNGQCRNEINIMNACADKKCDGEKNAMWPGCYGPKCYNEYTNRMTCLHQCYTGGKVN